MLYNDAKGNILEVPAVMGNKTEGSLILMIRAWGYNYEAINKSEYKELSDKIYAFNSNKKRSSVLIHGKDGGARYVC